MTDIPDEQAAPEGAGLLLSPDEIVNYELKRATRGYAIGAVDDLLDQLAVQTQDLLTTVTHLRQERDELRAALEQEREAETTLKKTLLTAQRAAEAALAEARDDAEAVRVEARKRADEALAEAAEQAHELRATALRRARAEEAEMRRYRRAVDDHVQLLRTFADDHRARLANHLQQQLARLDALELPEPPPPPERHTEDLLDEDSDAENALEALLAEAKAERAAPVGGEPMPAPADGAVHLDEMHEVDLFGDGG